MEGERGREEERDGGGEGRDGRGGMIISLYKIKSPI